MKKILIVGGTGFLGYHISKYFISKKFKVISISRKKPKKTKRLSKVKYLFSDISKRKKLEEVLGPHSDIKYIINLGGEINHKKSNEVYKSHFLGVKYLVSIFLKTNIKKFIQIGSSMEYGRIKSPQSENARAHPISTYGKSKLLATNYLIQMFKEKNFPALVLRPYQIYGPAQEENRLIPFVISQSLSGNLFPCSSGKQFRDFLYVADFVKCLDMLIRKKVKLGQILNVGYGKALKVKNVINITNKKINLGKPIFNKIKLRKEEQKYLFPSISKIKKVLGWKPKTQFDNGIDKTIKYFKNKKI